MSPTLLKWNARPPAPFESLLDRPGTDFADDYIAATVAHLIIGISDSLVFRAGGKVGQTMEPT
jgi:hypothetical protein